MSRRIQGFTLLEIMLVLFISTMMLALAGPRLSGRFQAYEQRYRIQSIEDGLRQLPRRARLMGKPVELPRDLSMPDLGDGQNALDIPEGWLVSFDPPLLVSPLGACSATRVGITIPEAGSSSPVVYNIAELSCDLDAQDPSNA